LIRERVGRSTTRRPLGDDSTTERLDCLDTQRGVVGVESDHPGDASGLLVADPHEASWPTNEHVDACRRVIRSRLERVRPVDVGGVVLQRRSGVYTWKRGVRVDIVVEPHR